MDLGNAWFVAGYYDKAASGYGLAQAARPENSSLALSQARAYFYAAEGAATDEQRELYNQQAVSTIEAAYITALWNQAPPQFLITDQAFQDFITEHLEERDDQ